MNWFNMGQPKAQVQEEKVRTDLTLFEREEKLKIKEKMFADKDVALDYTKSWLDSTYKQYYYKVSEKETELAKLDERILTRRELFAQLKDSKDIELSLLKESNTTILKAKDEVIELLKTQVEILTAKLTELKISDIHVHAEVKNKE
jgi:hypothetical protein